MTNSELRALPVGSRITCDDDEGEIVSSGPTVEVKWRDIDSTSYVNTESENWQSLVCRFEEKK